MADRRLTAARIRTILSRQFPTRWGPRYVPSQLATGGEAPSISRPRVLHSDKLQRQLHALSNPEAICFALAMYLPNLFELKEQHALSPAPCEHPLEGHLRARGMILPSSSGSVRIAERLGLLKHHPKVKETFGAAGGENYRWLPGPILRDMLLFLHDEAGPYCVCWDVKAKQGEHASPGPGTWAERSSPRRIATARALDAIYLEYMRELGIRVVRMSKDAIDPRLAENLLRLLEEHHHPIELGPQLHADIVGAFTEALHRGRPPNEVIDDYVQVGVSPDQARRVLLQAIWSRRIRIDLFRHWTIDRPLRPEVRDPLDYLAPWFRRHA